jgi:DNA-binding MarR family transcriptional regulator
VAGLIILDANGETNVNALAEQLGIDPSTCTRLCDRLVAKKLIERQWSPDRRRNVLLRLSPKVSALVEEAIRCRRAEITGLIEGLSEAQRRRLVEALGPLVAAADTAPEDAWALGWPG